MNKLLYVEVDQFNDEVNVCLIEDVQCHDLGCIHTSLLEVNAVVLNNESSLKFSHTLRKKLYANEIKIGNSASETIRQELSTLINKFREVFAKILSELNCTNLMKIDLFEKTYSITVTSYPHKTSPVY